jgi:signal transduction histidine kinase
VTLSFLIALHQRIEGIGHRRTANLSNQLAEKIRLTNNFNLIVLGVMTFYVVLYRSIGLDFAFGCCVFACFGFLANFALCHFGHFNFIRVNMSILACLGILGADLNAGFEIRVEAYYLAAVLVPFLTFEPSEKKWRNVTAFFPALFYFPSHIVGWSLATPLTHTEIEIFRYANAIGSYGIMLYFAVTFVNSIERNQESLVVSNKFSALGEMAAGIAHEINNPLAIIAGKASNLRTLATMPEFQVQPTLDCIEKIDKTVMRIAKVVRGLKNFSRTSDDDEFRPYGVTTIIDEALDLCLERVRSKDIRLEFVRGFDAEVNCRPVQISQVFLNLIGNAVDAIETAPERWIRIETARAPNGDIQISITDSGKGIHPFIAKKMMQPFYTTKPQGKGTGLGLSISRGIVEMHHGQLTYDHKLGNTRFTIQLPAIQSIAVPA